MDEICLELKPWERDISCHVIYISLHKRNKNFDSFAIIRKNKLSDAQKKEFEKWAKSFIPNNAVIYLEDLGDDFAKFIQATDTTKYEKWKCVEKILSDLG